MIDSPFQMRIRSLICISKLITRKMTLNEDVMSQHCVTGNLKVFSWCLKTWWRHQMETFSALLAICAGNSPVPGEFLAQRPVTWSFDVFFDLHLINGWVNNSEAGDLRRYLAHYDVFVMTFYASVLEADTCRIAQVTWDIDTVLSIGLTNRRGKSNLPVRNTYVYL